VNLRLNITDEDGIPTAFKVINGKTTDRSTPIDNMKALRDLLDNMPDSSDIIIISDQAMLDKDVIIQYHQQDIGYLGPLPANKDYEEVLMSVPSSQLQKHPLNYRPKNQREDSPAIYYGVLDTVSISGKKIEDVVSARVLLLYSTNKAKLDGDNRDKLLSKYLAVLEDIQKRINVRKYKKSDYTREQITKAGIKYSTVRHLVDAQLTGEDGELIFSFAVNAKQMELSKERDGRYLLVTNRPLSADEMLSHFKGQDKIEKHVHVIKGPIRIRPMFLHNQERIESLVFICMLALLVYSILEMLSKRANIVMTGESILKQFQTSTVVYTIFKDHSIWKQIASLTAFQSKLIQKLGFSDPIIYLEIVKLE
jgi:transposase